MVDGILRGPLAELFDSRQLLTDVSGAGNNWAVGHCVYGPEYRDSLSNVVRLQARRLRGNGCSVVGQWMLQLLMCRAAMPDVLLLGLA